jgi:hypothetical protein
MLNARLRTLGFRMDGGVGSMTTSALSGRGFDPSLARATSWNGVLESGMRMAAAPKGVKRVSTRYFED